MCVCACTFKYLCVIYHSHAKGWPIKGTYFFYYIFLYVCVFGCTCARSLSRGSLAAVLLIGVLGLGLVTMVTAICFDHTPPPHTHTHTHPIPPNDTRTHTHTRLSLILSHSLSVCPTALSCLSSTYLCPTLSLSLHRENKLRIIFSWLMLLMQPCCFPNAM